MAPDPIPFSYQGKPYRIDLAAMAVLVEIDGEWVPLRNLDLRADILRALNDATGLTGISGTAHPSPAGARPVPPQ